MSAPCKVVPVTRKSKLPYVVREATNAVHACTHSATVIHALFSLCTVPAAASGHVESPVVDCCLHDIVAQLHVHRLAQPSAGDNCHMLQGSQDAPSKLMAGRVQLNIVLTLALCVSERGQERGGSSRKGGGGWEKRESDG